MPRIVSDPVKGGDKNPEKYVVVIDGNSVDVVPEDLGEGTVRLNYDLVGVTEGDHSVQVTAVNKWGASEVVNFTFAATPPGAPSNVRLEF